METEDIILSGMSAKPSDMMSDNGSTSAALGVVFDNGGLRAIGAPKVVMSTGGAWQPQIGEIAGDEPTDPQPSNIVDVTNELLYREGYVKYYRTWKCICSVNNYSGEYYNGGVLSLHVGSPEYNTYFVSQKRIPVQAGWRISLHNWDFAEISEWNANGNRNAVFPGDSSLTNRDVLLPDETKIDVGNIVVSVLGFSESEDGGIEPIYPAKSGSEFAYEFSRDGFVCVCGLVSVWDSGLAKITIELPGIESDDISIATFSNNLQNNLAFDYNDKVVYLHTTSDYSHYISIAATKDGKGFGVWWYDATDKVKTSLDLTSYSDETFNKILSVGNILMVLSDRRMMYYIYKADYGYKLLGDHLPELDIFFTASQWRDSKFNTPNVWHERYNNASLNAIGLPHRNMLCTQNGPMEVVPTGLIADQSNKNKKIYNSDDIDKLTNAAYGSLNKAISSAQEQGLFVHPRLLRYALRLYDGSYVMPSVPVYVANYLIGQDPASVTAETSGGKVAATIHPYFLSYQISSRDRERLKDWSDIIKGVAFFSSEDIYDYDASQRIDSTTFLNKIITIFSGTDVNNEPYVSERVDTNISKVDLPHKSNSEIKTFVEGIANYYKIYEAYLEDYEQDHVMMYIEYSDPNVEDMTADTYTVSYNNKSKSIQIAEKTALDNFVKQLKEDIELLTGADMYVQSYNHLRRESKASERYVASVVMICRDLAKFNGLSITSLGTGNISITTEIIHNSDVMITDKVVAKNIVTQQVLKSGFMSHDYLVGHNMTIYNKRLSLCDVSRRVGQYVVPRVYINESDIGYFAGNAYQVIAKNGRKIISRSLDGSGRASLVIERSLNYLYSDFVDCEGIVIEYADNLNDWAQMLQGQKPWNYYYIPLKPSDVAQCSQAFVGLVGYVTKLTVDEETSVDNPSVKAQAVMYGKSILRSYASDYTLGTVDTYGVELERLDNMVITSEVDNPFVFFAANMTSVGSGRVVALKSNVTALSQGQFGSHPLYAFCTDGVWAMSVGNDGEYIAVQPVTNATIINNTLCALDGSVLFLTARAVVELIGSNTTEVTSVLDGDTFNFGDLDRFAKIVTKVFGDDSQTLLLPRVGIREYLKQCKLAYDYNNKRIYLYNPNYKYCYVYSGDSNMWTIVSSSISDTINSYPQSYCTDVNGDVIDLSSVNYGGEYIVITRPIKFGDRSAFKTVNNMICRCKGDVNIILYGSMDLLAWHLVGSCRGNRLTNVRGSGYRYYIVVLLGNMSDKDIIHYISAEFNYRLTDRMR